MTLNSQLLTLNSPLERYLSLGQRAGCPRDQMHNFARAGIVLQERQLAASAAARLCDRADGPTAVGYGGARGGGKSHWLLAQMGADDCQRVPGLKCLLLRKVGKANMEHFEDLRRRLFGGLDHEFSAYRGILTFANGSRIIAGHFQNESDIDAYLGLEYDIIGIEEATTLTHRKYQDISTCCRSSKQFPAQQLEMASPARTPQPSASGFRFQVSSLIPSGVSQLSTLNSELSTNYWRPRIYSTTNPGGIGHAWYRKLFIQPYLDSLNHKSEIIDHKSPAAPAETPSGSFPLVGRASPRAVPPPTEPPSAIASGSTLPAPGSTLKIGDTIFIPARVADNQYNNPEYRKVLESLSGWQRRAWLEGDWDLAAGQFFTSFRRDVHVVADFDETRAREWFAAMDYGFAHYTVFLLGCTDGDGNVFVVDEHAERLWLPQRHAAAIRAMLSRHRVPVEGSWLRAEGERPRTRSLELGDLRRVVAGADVFSRQSDGTTIAGQYAREGIRLKPANMDRVNGWAEVLQRLGEPNVGLAAAGTRIPARLFIHQRCGRLIETLPAMQHDPNRPEDVLKVDADEDGVGGDDTADCLRYLVATKPRTITQRKLRGL